MIALLLALLLGVTLSAAWHGHTDRSRRDAEWIRIAIAVLQEKLSAFGPSRLGVSEKEFCKQLAGRPLNHWRLADLPDDFQKHYDALKVGARGGVILEADDLAIVRGLDALPKPQMVKMTEPRRVILPLGSKETA